MRSVGAISALLASCASVDLTPGTLPTVRSVVGSDTGTAGKDGINVEAGVDVGPAGLLVTTTEVQWGATDDVDLFVGWVPIFQDSGSDGLETGEAALGVRYRFLEETTARPSMLLDLAIPVSDPDRGLGVGQVGVLSGLGVTKTIAGVSTTGFYQFGLFSNPDEGPDSLHIGTIQAAAWLSDPFHVFGEASVIFENGPYQELGVGTFGTGVTLSPSVVLDFGIAVFALDKETDFLLFVGVTWGAVSPRAQPTAAAYRAFGR